MSEEQLRETPMPKGLFARIALYVRQVIAELKLVTVPTWKQLLNYTFVVLMFVIAMMLFVALLDLVFGQLIIWLFANKTS